MRKKIWKKVLSISLSVALVVSSLSGVNFGLFDTEEAEAAVAMPSGTVSIHDPSIVEGKAEAGDRHKYYIFGSHMAWAYSDDLETWTTFTNNINTEFNTIFADNFNWSKKGDTGYVNDGNMWAPDVIWNPTLGKWCMYMSINGNAWNSSICMLTANSLDGNWTKVGDIVFSGFTGAGTTRDVVGTNYSAVVGNTTLPAHYKMSGYNPSYKKTVDGVEQTITTDQTTWNLNLLPHAIDPCVFFDGDNLYMSYGSWSGGIYILKLNPATGLRGEDYTDDYKASDNTTITDRNYTSKTVSEVRSDKYFGKKIAGKNMISGEASYIKKIGDYYYLFLSYGGFSANGGYQMRVYRSDAPDGIYKDMSGDPATSARAGNVNGSFGLRLMTYYKWDWMSYGQVAQGHNSVYVTNDDRYYVIYHTRTNDGTEGHFVRVHEMFMNEDGWLTAAPMQYSTTDTTTGCAALEMSDIAGSYNAILHTNTNTASKECVESSIITLNANGTFTGDSYSGTWSKVSGENKIKFDIGGTTYKGALVYQTKEGSEGKVLCFTAAGNDVSFWGVENAERVTEQEWNTPYQISEKTDFYRAKISKSYTIQKGEKITLDFENISGGTGNWNNWVTILTNDYDLGAVGCIESAVMRPDNCYNLEPTGSSRDCYYNDWDGLHGPSYLQAHQDGVNVRMIVSRGSDDVITVRAITTSKSDNSIVSYQIYKYNAAWNDANSENMRFYLSSDLAKITIKKVKREAMSVTEADLSEATEHTVETTPWWSVFSDYYTLEASSTKNHMFYTKSADNNCFNVWNMAFVNAERGGTGYAESLIVRGDNNSWGADSNSKTVTATDADGQELAIADITEAYYEGAYVYVTISRDGSNHITLTSKLYNNDLEYIGKIVTGWTNTTTTAGAPMKYWLSAEKASTYIFDGDIISNTVKKMDNVLEGYTTAATSKYVIVNASDSAKSNVSFELAGGENSKFEITEIKVNGVPIEGTTIASLAPNAQVEITVANKLGLSASETAYTETVNVKVDGVTAKTLKASVIVEGALKVVVKNEFSTSTLEEYTAANAPKIVYTLSNQASTQTITNITLALNSGSNFTISGSNTIASLAPGESVDVTVVAKTGLTSGSSPYSDKLVISGTGINTKQLDFSLSILKRTRELTITRNSAFTSQTEGYTTAPTVTYTIKNVGNTDLTNIVAVLATGRNFQITGGANISSLSVGATATITVKAITGLNPGTYKDTLTVMATGSGAVSESLSFTVNSKALEYENDPRITAYYTFNNNILNTYSKNNGTAKVHGGAGDTWNTASSGMTAYTTGINGNAYLFKGDGTTRGEGLELDVKTTSSFTISGWVKAEQKVNFQPIFFVSEGMDKYINVSTNFNDFASGALFMETGWSGTSFWLDKNHDGCEATVQDIPLNTWTYVTFTYDSKTKEAALYYNAELLDKEVTSGYSWKDDYLFLGINWWDKSFKGAMDDVVIFNQAITAKEVKEIYDNNGVPLQVVKGTIDTGTDEKEEEEIVIPPSNNTNSTPTDSSSTTNSDGTTSYTLSGAWWAAWTPGFKLEDKLTFSIDVKGGNDVWNNVTAAFVNVPTDGKTDPTKTAGYKEYLMIRPDNWGWGGGDKLNIEGNEIKFTSPMPLTLEELVATMKDAHIDATITKTATGIKLEYAVKGANGKSYTYVVESDFDTSKGVYVFFTCDNSTVKVTTTAESSEDEVVPTTEKVVGTKWWDDMQQTSDKVIAGDNKTWVYTIVAGENNGADAAFCVEITDNNGIYITTGSHYQVWTTGADGELTGNNPEGVSNLIPGHKYRVSVTREGYKFTINYYDVDADEEYCEFVVIFDEDVPLADELYIHVMAQVGEFDVTFEGELTDDEEDNEDEESNNASSDNVNGGDGDKDKSENDKQNELPGSSDDSKSEKTNTATIVAIVVGIVAGVVAVGGIIAAILYKKKKSKFAVSDNSEN